MSNQAAPEDKIRNKRLPLAEEPVCRSSQCIFDLCKLDEKHSFLKPPSNAGRFQQMSVMLVKDVKAII